MLSDLADSAVKMVRLAVLLVDDLQRQPEQDALSQVVPVSGEWTAASLPLPHLLIPSIIASVESYSSALFIESVEKWLDLNSRVHRGLWEENRDQATSSLVRMRKYWAGWFAIDYSDATPHWPKLQGFAHVRNAVVHGTGRLTPRQLNEPKTIKAVRNLSKDGVRLGEDDRLALTHEALTSCGQAAIDHIQWLDRKAADPLTV